ncbi:MAG TPA: hypothetical protein VFC39_16120 [Acidobacteriaceae bacterium]|nr:hypothetical protein [Acidobacteriaceae bacterium]
MSLERYIENSWLRKEATSPQEIADQLGIVSRCMKDANVEGISDDLRFYTTFNAVLALANIALRASGYRTANQQGHHTRAIETLEYTVQADNKLIRKILAFSKKRNVSSYDSAGSISNEELRRILTYCRGSAAYRLDMVADDTSGVAGAARSSPLMP